MGIAQGTGRYLMVNHNAERLIIAWHGEELRRSHGKAWINQLYLRWI